MTKMAIYEKNQGRQMLKNARYQKGDYVIMLVVFAVISGAVSAYKYDHSRSGMKKYFSRLNKLERFYNGQKNRK